MSEKKTAIHFDPIVFRAYDIRGKAGDTLTAELVYHIGRSVGTEIRNQGQDQIAVGRDGRLSSPELSQALIKGLLETGMHVTDVGMVPSPGLYFAVVHLGVKNGIMVTGSHNPKYDNGLKITLNNQPIFGEAVQQIRQRIEKQAYTNGEGSYQTRPIIPDYITAVQSHIVIEKPMKVVIDCGSGAASVVAPQLFSRIGCTVIPLACEVDGNFPIHHPDPSQPKNLQLLIETVKKEKADIGFAFDGDGDRVGVVTNEGQIIYPDRQLMLLAKDALSRNPGAKVIFDIKCTRHLAAVVRECGGEPIWYKTGHSVLKQKMLETGAILAGEMSGHFFIKERWFGFDDGPYSAIRILEILSKQTKTSAELFAQFPDPINTPEIHVAIPDAAKESFMDALIRTASFPGAEHITIDGLRIEYPDAWALMRVSNTTPNLVLRFEADTEARLKQLQLTVKAELLKVDPTLEIIF